MHIIIICKEINKKQQCKVTASTVNKKATKKHKSKLITMLTCIIN